jgi:hypothetical protein
MRSKKRNKAKAFSRLSFQKKLKPQTPFIRILRRNSYDFFIKLDFFIFSSPKLLDSKKTAKAEAFKA